MSKVYVPKELRAKVVEQAKHRCGYCLTSETVTGEEMNIEHLYPTSLGGLTQEDNLWLSCSKCNLHKSDKTSGPDPKTGESVVLFNPRTQIWSEHFEWKNNGTVIAGKTPEGRATVQTLNLNRRVLVSARHRWVDAGWHPPKQNQ